MTILSRSTRVGLPALAAAGLALGAAACGSTSSGGATSSASSGAAQSSAPASTASTASSSAAPAAATSSGPSASSGASGGGAVAAPGATFKAGQPAIVAFDTTTKSGKNGPSYKLNVDVESIKKGTLADFNGIQLDAAERAGTPFYVKVKITSLGPGKIATTDNDPAIQVEGVDNTGQTQQSVTFFGDFPKCDEKTPPNPMGAGSSFETCLTFLVPGGIQKVAYTGTEGYITKPVTWSP